MRWAAKVVMMIDAGLSFGDFEEVQVAVPLERLHGALEGGLHLPRWDISNAHALGHISRSQQEVLVHAGVEPVGVVDRVGGLPSTKVPVGEPDGVGAGRPH